MKPICARLSCPNYDEQAVKLQQTCSEQCFQAVKYPGNPHGRATSVEKVVLTGNGVYQVPSTGMIYPDDKRPERHQRYLEYCQEFHNTTVFPVDYETWIRYGKLLKPKPVEETVAGLSFSIVPQFELIPRIALVRLVRRAELGQVTKKEKAWNALSGNQEALASKEALAKRLGHAIDHATKLLEKLIAGASLYEPELNEDDAAALMWAGMYAICATNAMEPPCLPLNSPSNPVSPTTSKAKEPSASTPNEGSQQERPDSRSKP